MLTSNKGFTLIELMIVVTIIGILVAIVVPQFINLRINEQAEDHITRGIPVSQVESEKVRDRMIELLADDLADTEKKEAGDRLQQSVNNTVKPVLNKVEKTRRLGDGRLVTLSEYNRLTAGPLVYYKCDDNVGLLRKCVMTVNQHGIKFNLPVFCEEDSEGFQCEVR